MVYLRSNMHRLLDIWLVRYRWHRLLHRIRRLLVMRWLCRGGDCMCLQYTMMKYLINKFLGKL